MVRVVKKTAGVERKRREHARLRGMRDELAVWQETLD